jgi:Putative Flp pilus-assembly TadE/G-like
VLTLVLLPAMLVVAAFVVDVGYWFVTDRSAQNAADAAALAAAQELGDAEAARTKAEQYLAVNLPGSDDDGANPALVDTDIVTPYNGDPDKVEVTVRMRASSFFSDIVGLEGVDIEARAVAEKAGDSVPLAIFTKSTDCDPNDSLRFDGNSIDIDGAFHSNGGLEVDGNTFHADGGTAGGPNGCEPDLDGNNQTFGNDSEPTAHTTNAPWPREYLESDYWPSQCDFGPQQNITIPQSQRTIPPGVYCATQRFRANGNNKDGRITVIAPRIEIPGNNVELTAFVDDLVFFATDDISLVFQGNSLDITGNIFHPGGRVVLDDEGSGTLTGLIQAQSFFLDDNNWHVEGAGGVATHSVLALAE